MKRGKTISDWMSSALVKEFQDQVHDPILPSQSKGKIRSERKSSGSKDNNLPWITKYQPKFPADLAVHKKKVAEVQQWLEFALSSHAQHPMLLLTGPPGCGKTATLQALAGDMGFSVLEWVNPITNTGGPTNEDRQSGEQFLYQESQSKQFQNFLIRANRYPSLVLGGGGAGTEGDGALNPMQKSKVVLVEEFPNAFLKDPSKFYQVLKSTWNSLFYPLVFIVSESHRGGPNSSSLFKKDLVSQIDIHTINFNPVAHTSIVKTLQKIASAECQHTTAGKSRRLIPSQSSEVKFYFPPKEVMEGIAGGCTGDIRSAINSLQFICLKDPSDLLKLDQTDTTSTSRKRKASSSSCKPSSSKTATGSSRAQRQSSTDVVADLRGIGGRDNSLFLFRALGKILYFKRDSEKGVVDTLPSHLKDHERPPLLVDPESVVEHTQMSSDMFILYLHENYNDFFSDLEDIADGLAYMSDSDLLGQLWSDTRDMRLSLLGYSSSVACRGLIFSNKCTAEGKWRPLHKPQWNSSIKHYRENCVSARMLFLHLGSSPHAHLWTPVELQTEILPYVALINAKLRNPDQVALLQSITHFKSRYQRQFLDEKETGADIPSTTPSVGTDILPGSSQDDAPGVDACSHNSQSSSVTLSQNVVMTANEETDSGDEIEDFEDDLSW